MRNVRLPYAAARVAACVLFAFAAVCYQGCDKAAEDPYAELDARFPEGNPGLADAQTRAQDPAYIEKLTQGANRYATLRAEAEKAKAETERFRAIVREGLTKRMGKEVPEALLEAELAKNAHYAGLLKAQRAAEEAAEAQRNANRQAIRERARAGMEAYEALHDFMYSTVYVDKEAKREEQKVEKVITELYERLLADPGLLPDGFLQIAYQEGADRAVTDYISGMSDEFAIRMFEDLFVPKKWHVL